MVSSSTLCDIVAESGDGHWPMPTLAFRKLNCPTCLAGGGGGRARELPHRVPGQRAACVEHLAHFLRAAPADVNN